MHKLVLFLLAVSIGICACNKNKESAGVLVRVENGTTLAMTDVTSQSTDFGSLAADERSEYKYFDEVVAYPGALFTLESKQQVYAGNMYCGTPPLPYLEPGKYTLRIYPDENMYSGYNAVYEKD